MDMSQGMKTWSLRERLEQAARERAEREAQARARTRPPVVRQWGGGWSRDGQ